MTRKMDLGLPEPGEHVLVCLKVAHLGCRLFECIYTRGRFGWGYYAHDLAFTLAEVRFWAKANNVVKMLVEAKL